VASIPDIDISTPTIKDVARRAGVSASSVSRFLRGERVRNAGPIQQAVDELGFRPSPLARSLKSGLTQHVALVVPDVSNPFFAEVVKGSEAVSRRAGYNILLVNTDESVEREHEVMAALAGRVDGIILAPATERAEAVADLRRAGAPIVFLDRELEGNETFDCVLVDNAGGARLAAEHLIELGHERIGLISGPLDTTPGRGRHEGFVDALAESDIELSPSYVQIADFREEGGYQATLRLLAAEPPPSAVFAANNFMSIGALRALDTLGVTMPDELSFVGFDDLKLAELLKPSLTVVSRPTEEQGALAMRLLLDRLGGKDNTPPRRIVLETKLTVRGSTAAPAALHAALARREAS
jgi:LacI family transcriptional regulator